MRLRVGIVGCGLIGSRRARVAAEAGDDVVAVADVAADRAVALARDHGARSESDWRAVVEDPDVDAVVVATFNTALVDVASAALEAGKHVLCEKPFGCNANEALQLLEIASRADGVVKVGFTLRHHEAVARAHALVEKGEIGTPVALRAAYGHGGRPGYDREWRGDPTLAGGGELLDQGVHLVDLSRWFLGNFARISGAVGTWVWQVEPLEDNGFALLQTADGRVATLHTSWTQWRNLFRLEVLGTEGLVTVNGLGGSYGPETLVHARRRPEGGPPDEREWAFEASEVAWTAEWQEFADAVRHGRDPLGTAADGYEAARVVDAIYESARSGETVRLEEVQLA
jgi:predicted dehydrogenase